MNVAFIPVRGGSKSIPFKNIKDICGKPLVFWAIQAACKCHYIDKVYVATDSERIVKTVEKIFDEEDECFKKINIVGRSEESASDTASTEFAMLEFAAKYDFDNIALIQATSPLISHEDLDKGFAEIENPEVNSVFSAVRQKRFNWMVNEKGFAYPTNYDFYNRPRRQDFEGYLVENGAFYITSKSRLLETKCRMSGNIKAIEMVEDSFFEIDEPSDWSIIENLMKKNGLDKNRIVSDIKLFLTDCDGCLTDGGMYYSELGDELKKFNAKDGMGFSLLKNSGIVTGIITGESVSLNRRRAEKIKADYIITGCKSKITVIEKICSELGIGMENVAYMGDDINDLEALKAVGLSFAPDNAVREIKEAVDCCVSAYTLFLF